MLLSEMKDNPKYKLHVRYLQNYVDSYDPVVFAKLIMEILGNIKSEEELSIYRSILSTPEMKQLAIKLCCLSPIGLITSVRALGLATLMQNLIHSPVNYEGIEVEDFRFCDMFKCEDAGAMKRALIPYFMSIRAEYMPNSDIFQDYQIHIYNSLLDVAIWLKSVPNLLPNGITCDEIISSFYDILFCDGIGSDLGEDLFYNKFVGTYVMMGLASSMPEITETHDKLLNKLTDVGNLVVRILDTEWEKNPERMVIYMNLRQMMSSNRPDMAEYWKIPTDTCE